MTRVFSLYSRRDPLRAFRKHGRFDVRLGCDVLRRVDIGVGRVSAGGTDKASLIEPGGFVAVAARMARLRRVRGVDHHERDTRSPRLVGAERLPLREGPSARLGALRLRKPYPRPNAVQVLNGNPALRAFGKPYDLLGDAVIHVAPEPTFMLSEPLEGATDILRAATLPPLACGLAVEPAAAVILSLSDPFDYGSGENLTVRRGGELRDAEVHAQVVGGRDWGSFRHVAGDVQVEPALALNQNGENGPRCQHSALPFSAPERDTEPSAINAKPHDVAWTELYRVCPAKDGECRALERGDDGSIRDQAHGDSLDCRVCDNGTSALVPQHAVSGSMQRRARGGSRLPHDSDRSIGRGRKRAHTQAQHFGLFGRWMQGELNRQFHTSNIITFPELSDD